MSLPSFNVVARRWPRRRAVAGVASAVLSVAAIGSAVAPHAAEPQVPASLAAALPDRTWAFAIPTVWLAAPIPGLRPNDRVDILALRPGERAAATVVAADLVVVTSDDRLLIVGATADDATSLAIARAGGLMLVPLLRSPR